MEGRLPSRAPQKGKGAGGTGTKPGQYPIGSLQSRAAARSLLDAKGAMEGEGTRLVFKAIGSPAPPGTQCTCLTALRLRNTGIDLQRDCKTVLAANMTAAESVNAAHCLGYISGAAFSISMWEGTNKDRHVGLGHRSGVSTE